MPKQTLFLTSALDVSVENGLLKMKKTDEQSNPLYRSLEDIHIIIVDNHSVHFTVPSLCLLGKSHIPVVFCDERHMPITVLTELDGSSVQGKIYRAQLGVGAVKKKRLWKQVVEWKIRNQSRLLERLELGNDPLKRYYQNVCSGDSTNREGQAAKLYWKTLFGRTFIRSRYGEAPNNLLNYGYSILRAYIARALIGSGLLPSIGINHKSYFNALPLADDIMEPYRPFIDEAVFYIFAGGVTDIDKTVKYELANIFYERISLNQLSQTTHSLAACFAGEADCIYYPLI
ncbi:MAG: type II CRISPR-associated endonuclease Cas1 [Alloprevotella sp.]|nr:type II CRISPR-associated endonuclease Cas1 [Alloprevotella sp.]